MSFSLRLKEYASRLFIPPAVPLSWKQLVWGRRAMASLLKEDTYIARSDMDSILASCEEALLEYRYLEENDLLKEYCRRFRLDPDKVSSTLLFYGHIDSIVKKYNRGFVARTLESQRDYLDHILDSIDPAIRLDEDQRRMVVTDEDYCLVIAGAGAGKTTAVAAKVRYLTEKCAVSPD